MLKKAFLFITEKLLWLQTIIILSIVYFLFLGPVAVLGKLSGANFYKEPKSKNSFWQKRKVVENTLEETKKLF